MYAFLLYTHSLFRWIVLVSLIYAIYRAYAGWLSDKAFTPLENSIQKFATTVVNIQFLIGLWLYFKSPIVGYFWDNFKVAVHERDIRFFGMEHITMMFIAVSLINTGSGFVKRRGTDKAKFKTVAIWFTIGLVIIFISIPWGFSPFTRRPYFRPYSSLSGSRFDVRSCRSTHVQIAPTSNIRPRTSNFKASNNPNFYR